MNLSLPGVCMVVANRLLAGSHEATNDFQQEAETRGE